MLSIQSTDVFLGLYSSSSVLTVNKQDLSLLTKQNKTFQLIRRWKSLNEAPLKYICSPLQLSPSILYYVQQRNSPKLFIYSITYIYIIYNIPLYYITISVPISTATTRLWLVLTSPMATPTCWSLCLRWSSFPGTTSHSPSLPVRPDMWTSWPSPAQTPMSGNDVSVASDLNRNKSNI